MTGQSVLEPATSSSSQWYYEPAASPWSSSAASAPLTRAGATGVTAPLGHEFVQTTSETNAVQAKAVNSSLTSPPQTIRLDRGSADQHRHQAFIQRRIATIEEEPVQAGMSHSADAILREAVQDEPRMVGRWLLAAFNQVKTLRPSSATELPGQSAATEPMPWLSDSMRRVAADSFATSGHA